MPSKSSQEETTLPPPEKKSKYIIFSLSLHTDRISLVLFNYLLIGKRRCNILFEHLLTTSTSSFIIDSQAEKLYTILGNQNSTTNTTIVRQHQGDHELGAYIIHHNAKESPIQYKASLPEQEEDKEISKRASVINVGVTTIGRSLLFTIEIGPLLYITGVAILAFIVYRWSKGG